MSSVINVRLNERMTVQFVELYRDERLLWDKEHESYNKRTERLRAYRRIADGMAVEGLGVPEVASKIKNIRSTYLQELKKIKDSAQRHLVQSEEEEASSPYVPKLLWFPILDSMIGDVAVKRLYASPPASDMLRIEYVDEERSAMLHSTVEYNNNADSDYNDSPGNGEVHRKRTSSCDRYPASKRLRSYESQQQSSTELFAKYIATTVESLPPRLALQAQKEVHDVLIKYKLMECDQDRR